MTQYRDSYTTLHVEASLCLWEWMLENRDGHADLLAPWEARGTVEMRHLALRLGPSICEVWDGLDDDSQQMLIPYDWEFVPRLVLWIDWSLGTLDVAEAIAALTAPPAE